MQETKGDLHAMMGVSRSMVSVQIPQRDSRSRICPLETVAIGLIGEVGPLHRLPVQGSCCIDAFVRTCAVRGGDVFTWVG